MEKTQKDLRLAFVGNVDSGKSSLIGTLMNNELDDGRGSSRKSIFRHRHEAESGRTSSISTTFIGFSECGNQIVSKKRGKPLSWIEIAKQSCTRVQLIDLAGHEKYLKTTVFGLTGMQPDAAVVVIGANMGVKKMTKEHLGIAIALDIPVIVALTKIDVAPKNIAKETVQNIRKYLKSAGKMPILVKTLEEATKAAETISSNRVTSILPISNVTGDGLDNLRRLIACLTPRIQRMESLSSNVLLPADLPMELQIDATYVVPGVGFVISGILINGMISVNESAFLGPDHNGKFLPVVVKSIESMHIPIREIRAGQTATLAIRSTQKKEVLTKSNFRKGMVLVKNIIDLPVSMIFEARVLILHHQTTISKGYQPVIHCRTIRQTAELISIEGADGDETIRTGDRALVRFRFVNYAEYLKPKESFIFRDGQAKGVGKVVRVILD